MTRYASRIALAVVATLLGVEIALQILAVIGPRLLTREGGTVSEEAALVIAVGDSHTFGAVPRSDAYPAQLEARLRDRNPDRSVSVVNLGLSGLNSTMVANRLEGQVRRMRPDLIVVWAGLNDSWNLNEVATDAGDEWLVRIHQRLLPVRLYRLATVLWSTGDEVTDVPAEHLSTEGGTQRWRLGGEVVEVGMPSGELPSDDRVRRCRESALSRMIAVARAHGVPILFVTYPLTSQQQVAMANHTIETTAAGGGAPVIDSAEALRIAHEAGYKNKDLFVIAAGPHPNRLLYTYVVDLMLPVVERMLQQSDSWPASASPDAR